LFRQMLVLSEFKNTMQSMETYWNPSLRDRITYLICNQTYQGRLGNTPFR
jgi:hypothetical protein